MRIKVALLEKDQSYLTRIMNAFNLKYSDKLEMYSFTNQEVALRTLKEAKINVLVAGESFDVNVSELPKWCAFAYLVDSFDVSVINDRPAICKFQRADLIYKQILSIYAETAGNTSGLKGEPGDCRVVAFTSPSGGVGASTAAAACAVRYAGQGKKTLYLNLEKYGSADVFFTGEGQLDMSDVIFALKSKKANMSIKLESCVKQDRRGVYFFSQPKVALDMLELKAEELVYLVKELKTESDYAYIILDLDFSLDGDALKLLNLADGVVWVTDGTEISTRKTQRAYEALSIREQGADAPITTRLCLMYNKATSRSSRPVGIEGLRCLDPVESYGRATTEQIIGELSGKELLDKIL